MSFDIVAYQATRMKAAAKHGESCHWVVVTVIEPQRRGPTHESEITVHFADAADARQKADAYARAINTVDQLFHPAEVAREREDANV